MLHQDLKVSFDKPKDRMPNPASKVIITNHKTTQLKAESSD